MLYVEYKGTLWSKRGQHWFRVEENEKDVCEGDDIKAGTWCLGREMKGQNLEMGRYGMCSGNGMSLHWSTGCVSICDVFCHSFSKHTSLLVPTTELSYPWGSYQLLHGQSWKGLSSCPCPKEGKGPYLVPLTYYPWHRIWFKCTFKISHSLN